MDKSKSANLPKRFSIRTPGIVFDRGGEKTRDKYYRNLEFLQKERPRRRKNGSWVSCPGVPVSGSKFPAKVEKTQRESLFVVYCHFGKMDAAVAADIGISASGPVKTIEPAAKIRARGGAFLCIRRTVRIPPASSPPFFTHVENQRLRPRQDLLPDHGSTKG